MKVLRRKIQKKQLLQYSLILGFVTLVSAAANFALVGRVLAQQAKLQKIQIEIIGKENTEGVNRNILGQPLWEWIKLASPLLIGTGAVLLFQWLNSRRDKNIAAERNQQDILKDYLDQIIQLIVKQDIPDIKQDKIIQTVVRARTLTVLRELDGKRKGVLIRFLTELEIIEFIDLSEVDLNKADLRETYLKKAVLYKAELKGANLYQANLDESNLERANLEGANLEGASICQAQLEGANLKEAFLKRSRLMQSHLNGVHLEKANLEKANLEESNLTGSHLEKTDFYQAHLQKANLEGANLEGANLEEAILAEANLFRANLKQANLSETNLEEVRNLSESQLILAKNWRRKKSV
jgi:uncharacterized protein YjbI with pentapeptide repeats